MGAALRDSPAALAIPSRAPVAALQDLIGELMELLLSIPAGAYTATPAGTSGSVGGHVRHILDHVAAFVSPPPSGVLSYDHRMRGTAVEHDPPAAIREILRLQAALQRLTGASVDTPVTVSMILSARGDRVTGWSTVARELGFIVSHTIHHQAMIALLLEMQGLRVAHERFGYAPTTPS